MSTAISRTCVALLALAAAACSEENRNPGVLWLDLDGSEIKVRLVEQEPVPFCAPGVGAGRSQEAGFALVADVPAGSWKLIGDGVILQSVDVTFEVLLRRGGADLPVVSWQHHFDPLPDGVFDAVPYEATATGTAITYRSGDQLIFRYTGDNATSLNAYVPNGDGARQNGRIPNLTLP